MNTNSLRELLKQLFPIRVHSSSFVVSLGPDQPANLTGEIPVENTPPNVKIFRPRPSSQQGTSG
jgi:hypothetical protein